ncbi:nicotinate-nucleotide adenylyltransferase [Lentibacillus cibarius]|uniref:Probable nicotinate-nucleotide adenylyltransferase n=1 Tax=Lentibacillus cibarius TaxID=2583219 RepID=A0A5S3QGK6_9BACI|nr:nicotinate-nucleotide adenylyltransferase [Lentibacillus cibarius]TMN21020.1 nicotinate-nucleotide adenylyltransferase [Lentibacillus cibarius]
MKHVGILGGTFDPPHIGHLIVAEEVRVALELDEVWLMPSSEPPHKQTAAANGEQRVKMAKNAIIGNHYFKVNTIEMSRSGKSYTYDTIKLLMDEHPDISFYFIIGADMVEYLPHWKQIDELMEMIQFVGVKRKGFRLESDYPIIEIDIPLIDISSTDVKKRLASGRSIKYLVPESVETFIKENHLYEER